MQRTLFPSDNRIKVNYGQWNFLRSNGKRHKGGDVSTTTAPFEILRVVSGCIEFAGSAPKTAADPYTWEWGYHERCYVNQNDAVRRVGTVRAVYAHCTPGSLTGRAGQVVQAGTVLGVMGNSGNAVQDSQGKHVHFQVDRWNGSAWVNIDPAPYIGGTNIAGAVWYGDGSKDEVQYMKVFKIMGAAKGINVQGMADFNTNAVAANHLADGIYAVNADKVSRNEGFDWCVIYYPPLKRTLAMPYGGVLNDRCAVLDNQEPMHVIPAILEQEGAQGGGEDLRPALEAAQVRAENAEKAAADAQQAKTLAEEKARAEAQRADVNQVAADANVQLAEALARIMK